MALANEQRADSATALSAEDQDQINAMNASIDGMRAFTPTDPYILTIPQDVEPRYHHNYAFQARQWLDHTPFEQREHESIQYQTFIYHEPGKEIYMLHNSRPPNSERGASANERAGTGANTPSGAPKKKISLNAYKKKQSGSTPDVASEKEGGQAVRKPAAKGPVEHLKADEDVLAAVEEDSDFGEPYAKKQQKDLKRKREDNIDPKTQQKQHDTPREQDQPIAKKTRRTSPPPQPVKQTDELTAREEPVEPVKSPGRPLHNNTEQEEGASLPPKLSPPPSAPIEPVLPPESTPITIPALPDRLSPTIPANISATLKARAHYRSTSRGSDVSVSKEANGRTLTPPPKGLTKKKSPAPRNGFRANSSSPAVRSDVEERGRPLTSVPPRVRTPELDPGFSEDSEEIAVSRVKRPVAEKPPSLIVKLKFKKSARESVRRILKMRPNPVKATPKASDQRHRERLDANGKGVAQKLKPGKTTNGVSKEEGASSPERKRSRMDDSEESEERPVKRKKVPVDSMEPKKHGPSTPVQADISSPPNIQKSASQSQLTPNTLRKDVLSAAMKREQSTDSNTMHTPSAMNHMSPPDSQIINSANKPTPSSQPSNMTPKQQAWESERVRFEALGRELKHAASAHLKSLSTPHADANAPSNEHKLAAIKSMESLLSYMLAFTCADEAAMAADPKANPSVKPWRSLHGFFGFVKRNCDSFPVLLGVACWLGVVFNAKILDLTTQHPADGHSRDMILETQAMMLRASNDAETKLDVDALQSAFPRTWKAREKGVLDVEKREPRKSFIGPYKLPLGVQTCPVRGARAAYSMLEEWMDKQNPLEYELKLKL